MARLALVALVALAARVALAEPIVLGLANKHPLTQPQMGELLMSELRCAACHRVDKNSSANEAATLERSAPDLSDVGARVAPRYLRQFLASPSSAHPGTTMPDVLAAEPGAKREEMVEALTHFLVAQSTRPFTFDVSNQSDLNAGKELFHSVGCVACHGPREEMDKAKNVDLGHLPDKYSQQSLSEFLFQPLRVRSSGRMPDLKLTPVESQAIASYLLGPQKQDREALQPNDRLVGLGKKYFQELNCVACHPLNGMSARDKLVSLSDADLSRGCLADASGKSPRFNLDTTQVGAIRAALKEATHVDTDEVQLAKTLTALNCIACHIRDGYGGVSQDRNLFFQTSEKNLGDDGRIPPPLTLVGAKLKPLWLRKVLFDGESVRHYMPTRMPQYGEPNLRHFPELVGRLDIVKGVELKIPNPESRSKSERESEKSLRTAGRELLGQQGLYCISCHNFNGKPSPLNKGIDLMTTYERLQPVWFSNFLRNPGAYRPRIIMPYSWAGGEAVHKTILDGDTDKQIEAIWYYLSLGTSAADPPGLRRIDTILSVADSTRTYRGRSSVAGFRGIAVGFPEKLSYAFNAETGTLAAIWTGEFIRVDRGGQGSGGFNPSGQAIPLAQDVSFFDLTDEKTPWPMRPVMNKEAPVNPDPLYPKNLGYQFKGYYLDDASIPTFMYRSNEIEIEDRSIAVKSEETLELKRTIDFRSPTNRTIWFRALTGDIESESKFSYKTDKLRLSVPDSQTLLRSMTENPKPLELLLKLEIPAGKSTLSLNYEPLKK